MDKAERVAELIRHVQPGHKEFVVRDIAAILRREYAHEPWMALKEFTDAARREAFEEAARTCDKRAEAFLVPGADDRTCPAAACRGDASAIRELARRIR